MTEPTLNERLYEINLREFERLQKQSSRLQSEISSYVQTLTLEALAEAQLDHVKVGIDTEHTVDQVEEVIHTLQDKREKQLRAAKASIFNCSNDLKQLHDRRNVLTAQGQELLELEQETG